MNSDLAVRKSESRLERDRRNAVSWKRILSPRYRTAWVVSGVFLCLTLVLALPPVQALASRFLSVFRVRQFSVVQVDPQNLQQLDQLGSSSLLAKLISDTARIEPWGKQQEPVAAAEASALAGIQMRLPAAIVEPPRWIVRPGATITLYLDLPRIRDIFREIGRAETYLPENLDGSSAVINIPPLATAFFGDCRNAPGAPQTSLDPQRSCTILTQSSAPSVTVPRDLNTNQLGMAMLQLLGMTEADASEFSRNIDWSSTFVIPIPRNMAGFEEAAVEGVKGILIWSNAGSGMPRYLLLWTKSEILYSLSGVGQGSDALAIADSLQ